MKEKQYYITFNVTRHQLLRKRKISCRLGLPQKFVAISTSVTSLWPSRCQLKWRSDPYFPVKNSGTFRIFICSAALVTCFVIPTCLVGSVITLCPISTLCPIHSTHIPASVRSANRSTISLLPDSGWRTPNDNHHYHYPFYCKKRYWARLHITAW